MFVSIELHGFVSMEVAISKEPSCHESNIYGKGNVTEKVVHIYIYMM